jgi:phospholipid-transporting ATPase
VHKEGYNMGLGGFGITLLTAIIFVTSSIYTEIVDIKISLFTKFWTWLNFISLIIFSILLYFIYMLFSQELIGTLALYTPFTLLKVAHFWLLIVILCGAVFLYDLVQGRIIREDFLSETDQLRVFVKHF